MNKIFAIILLCSSFSLHAMRVPSLQTICIASAADYICQNFNLDKPLLEQTEGIKKCLKRLPRSLQDTVIAQIDFMLCPQWQEVKHTAHEGPSYFESLTRSRSGYMGCNSSGFFVHDTDNEITYQKHNQERDDPIEKIMKVPNSPLLLGLSLRAVSFFSSRFPFSFLGAKSLDGEKHCVVTKGERPVMYVATPHKILTFLCDCIEDKTFIESQNFSELSFFNDYVKDPDNSILSLALTHDNRFLYVGCKKKCYEIRLGTEMLESIPYGKVDHIIIADDDSIVALAKKYKRKTKIISRKTAVNIDGVALCIKNNIIVASTRCLRDNLLAYDIHGNVLKKFIIAKSLYEHPLYYFAIDQNNFPSLINIVYGFKSKKYDVFCVPEKLTIDSIDKLAFKITVEKAIDGNRKDILNRLLADRATLSLFPQPSILRCRIADGLDAKERVEEEPSYDVCITIREQLDNAKEDVEPTHGSCAIS